MSFNPWYVGGGVKRQIRQRHTADAAIVSILGMLEGVLKVWQRRWWGPSHQVSILGMLEGVLKAWWKGKGRIRLTRFNPWYVGGGVKSIFLPFSSSQPGCFNPWYVGGGVKSVPKQPAGWMGEEFQSLVCWRGC